MSYVVIIQLIGATQTAKGLKVDCELDSKEYKTGIKIEENKMEEINLKPNSFHVEWNYSILPQ